MISQRPVDPWNDIGGSREGHLPFVTTAPGEWTAGVPGASMATGVINVCNDLVRTPSVA